MSELKQLKEQLVNLKNKHSGELKAIKALVQKTKQEQADKEKAIIAQIKALSPTVSHGKKAGRYYDLFSFDIGDRVSLAMKKGYYIWTVKEKGGTYLLLTRPADAGFHNDKGDTWKVGNYSSIKKMCYRGRKK